MTNIQINSSISYVIKLSKLRLEDYDTTLSVALLLKEMRDRNDTFLSEYGKLNSEYFANDCDGKPIYQNGVPVIKHGKTLDEYNNELARLADADAQITRNLPIKVNKATFNSELPPPEDILALDGLIEFEESK